MAHMAKIGKIRGYNHNAWERLGSVDTCIFHKFVGLGGEDC